ncbi:MAG: YeeE/YedE family protein [Rhizobiaceae bacterium]|nr:YeeE/YedE family protein [Rhizobiaceae bacterium]
MTQQTKLLSAFLIGGLFGLGILIGGMANPAKIMNFFDLAGTFDPSLIFVMGGALVTTFIGYRVVFARLPQPAFEPAYDIPQSRLIDARLIGGATLFGIGWGITGFCPGGAIPGLALGHADVWVFVAALVVGVLVGRRV